jgi:enoyl-CoA hydratase/carnithine racemase
MAKVETEADRHVFAITINRPDQRNCVDGEAAALLHDAWLRFRDDDALYVAILTGAGDEAFCAGADLKALDTLGPGPDASRHARRRFISDGPGYMLTPATELARSICELPQGALRTDKQAALQGYGRPQDG